MARREFLQLAKAYRSTKDDVSGWYLSEKLDGTRCLWDGGISRGCSTLEVPWASVNHPRTGEPKAKVKPIATGLWSRYGNPIIAPDEFLDKLPNFPLDGELWAGRGNFQTCRSICAGDEADPRFMDQIKFAVFSAPPLTSLFQTGLVKNTNMVVDIDYLEIQKWFQTRQVSIHSPPDYATLEQEYLALQGWAHAVTWDEQVFLLRQTVLSADPELAKIELNKYMDDLLDVGAEGIILRDPSSKWSPKRVGSCLKFKPFSDDEGTITGFTSGRETDKGSKLLGMIGALILDYKGERLELSGLNNEERQFVDYETSLIATQMPGSDMPSFCQGKHFKVGDKVTFKYRELSDEGIPKEARFWRTRNEE